MTFEDSAKTAKRESTRPILADPGPILDSCTSINGDWYFSICDGEADVRNRAF